MGPLLSTFDQKRASSDMDGVYQMRLGRNRPTRPSPHPLLAKYLSLSTLPTPPASVDYGAAAIPVAGQGLQDILGNDRMGDEKGAGYDYEEQVVRLHCLRRVTRGESPRSLRRRTVDRHC